MTAARNGTAADGGDGRFLQHSPADLGLLTGKESAVLAFLRRYEAKKGAGACTLSVLYHHFGVRCETMRNHLMRLRAKGYLQSPGGVGPVVHPAVELLADCDEFLRSAAVPMFQRPLLDGLRARIGQVIGGPNALADNVRRAAAGEGAA